MDWTRHRRPRFPPVRTASHGDDLVGRLLAYDGRIDEGLELLRGMYDRASVENRSILPAILGWMAEAQLMAGRFLAALDLTREAVDRAEEIGRQGRSPVGGRLPCRRAGQAGPGGRGRVGGAGRSWRPVTRSAWTGHPPCWPSASLPSHGVTGGSGRTPEDPRRR